MLLRQIEQALTVYDIIEEEWSPYLVIHCFSVLSTSLVRRIIEYIMSKHVSAMGVPL